jgi:hypothetical protein
MVCSEIGDIAGRCHPNPLRRSHSSAPRPAGVQPHPLSRYPASPNSPGAGIYRLLAGVARWSFLFAFHTLPDALPMWLPVALTCSPSLQLATTPVSRPSPTASVPVPILARPYPHVSPGQCGDAAARARSQRNCHKDRLSPSCGPSA